MSSLAKQPTGSNIRYIVGIDEVGRGPLAGPVAVGAVVVPSDFDEAFFDGVRDSKKLTPKRREEWFEKIKKEKKNGALTYTVCFTAPELIDSYGIVWAIRSAIDKALLQLTLEPEEYKLFLDGGLHAPEQFIYQETIIKGDEKKPIIALASIMAKVERDRKMILFGEQYPEYGFDAHKGYGTKAHFQNIKEHGICSIHRKSFLRSFLAK